MGDEECLFLRDGGKLVHQLMRLMRVAADPDQPGETMRIAQPGLQRHQAALRKPKQEGVLSGKAGFALLIQQLEKEVATALHARRGVVVNVVPRKAAVVVVRRVDQQVVELWVFHDAGKPAVALHAVAESVQHDHQPF